MRERVFLSLAMRMKWAMAAMLSAMHIRYLQVSIWRKHIVQSVRLLRIMKYFLVDIATGGILCYNGVGCEEYS